MNDKPQNQANVVDINQERQKRDRNRDRDQFLKAWEQAKIWTAKKRAGETLKGRDMTWKELKEKYDLNDE